MNVYWEYSLNKYLIEHVFPHLADETLFFQTQEIVILRD